MAMNAFAKSAVSAVVRQLAGNSLNAILARTSRRRHNLLHVLTYHRVDWPHARPHLCSSTLSASPPDFAAQMECLREHFQVVTLHEVLAAVRREIELPPRCVLITFDDAYRDFAEHAWPVLSRLELPATMFVATSFADQPQRAFWWDRLHQVVASAPLGEPIDSRFGSLFVAAEDQRLPVSRRLARHFATLPFAQACDELERLSDRLNTPTGPPAVLQWNELRHLAAEGLTLAPHTQTHPLLPRIPLEVARQEVLAARSDLLAQISTCYPAFAYPGGAYDSAHRLLLQEEGFELAFTTCRGANDLRDSDPLQLRRINVGRGTTPQLLRAQLLLTPAVINRLVRLARVA